MRVVIKGMSSGANSHKIIFNQTVIKDQIVFCEVCKTEIVCFFHWLYRLKYKTLKCIKPTFRRGYSNILFI